MSDLNILSPSRFRYDSVPMSNATRVLGAPVAVAFIRTRRMTDMTSRAAA